MANICLVCRGLRDLWWCETQSSRSSRKTIDLKKRGLSSRGMFDGFRPTS
jgi:hypothetical protein